MKNYKLILGILVLLLTLTGCAGKDEKELIKETNLEVNNLEFRTKGYMLYSEILVELDTELEHLVYSLDDVTFKKDLGTDSKSKVNIKEYKEGDINSSELVITLNAEDIKKYSKEYTKEYDENLVFKENK